MHMNDYGKVKIIDENGRDFTATEDFCKNNIKEQEYYSKMVNSSRNQLNAEPNMISNEVSLIIHVAGKDRQMKNGLTFPQATGMNYKRSLRQESGDKKFASVSVPVLSSCEQERACLVSFSSATRKQCNQSVSLPKVPPQIESNFVSEGSGGKEKNYRVKAECAKRGRKRKISTPQECNKKTFSNDVFHNTNIFKQPNTTLQEHSPITVEVTEIKQKLQTSLSSANITQKGRAKKKPLNQINTKRGRKRKQSTPPEFSFRASNECLYDTDTSYQKPSTRKHSFLNEGGNEKHVLNNHTLSSFPEEASQNKLEDKLEGATLSNNIIQNKNRNVHQLNIGKSAILYGNKEQTLCGEYQPNGLHEQTSIYNKEFLNIQDRNPETEFYSALASPRNPIQSELQLDDSLLLEETMGRGNNIQIKEEDTNTSIIMKSEKSNGVDGTGYLTGSQTPLRFKINLAENRIIYPNSNPKSLDLVEKEIKEEIMMKKNYEEIKIIKENKTSTQFLISPYHSENTQDFSTTDCVRKSLQFPLETSDNSAKTECKFINNIPHAEGCQPDVALNYLDISNSIFHDENYNYVFPNIDFSDYINFCNEDDRETCRQEDRLINSRKLVETEESKEENDETTQNHYIKMYNNSEKDNLSQKNGYNNVSDYSDFCESEVLAIHNDQIEYVISKCCEKQEEHSTEENILNEKFILERVNKEFGTQVNSKNSVCNNVLILSRDMTEKYKSDIKSGGENCKSNSIDFKSCENQHTSAISPVYSIHNDESVSLSNETYKDYDGQFTDEFTVNQDLICSSTKKDFIKNNDKQSDFKIITKVGTTKVINNCNDFSESIVCNKNTNLFHNSSDYKNNEYERTSLSSGNESKNLKKYLDATVDSESSYVLTSTDMSDNCLLSFSDVLNLNVETKSKLCQTEENSEMPCSIQTVSYDENTSCKKYDNSVCSVCSQDIVSGIDFDDCSEMDYIKEDDAACDTDWSNVNVSTLLEESSAMKAAVVDLVCLPDAVQKLQEKIESKDSEIQSLKSRIEKIESNPLVKIVEHVISEFQKSSIDHVTSATTIVKILYSYAKEKNLGIDIGNINKQ